MKALAFPEPSEDEVRRYLMEWNTLAGGRYCRQEEALNKLFFDLCPCNTELSDVLLKSAVLNDFYSTNIYDVSAVAQHILSLNIDERLRNGDPSLVADIQRVNTGKRIINFHSFATKYCSHHNANDFPIQDYYVEKVLKECRDANPALAFNNSAFLDYAEFKRLLARFQTCYGLEAFTFKQIDQYLWQLGKKFFPRKY